MIIPNMPTSPVVNQDGELTREWFQFFAQLTTELQINLNDEVYKIPQQPTTNINQLTDASFEASIVYDSTIDEFKVNKNGVWETIDTTP